MARCSALAGSLVVHGAIALGIVTLTCHGSSDRLPPPRPVAVELVDPPPPAPSRASSGASAASGGSAPVRVPAPPSAPRPGRPTAMRTPAPTTRPAEFTMRIEPPAPRVDEIGGAGGTQGGTDGRGRGGGRGDGTGLGDGRRIDPMAIVASLPVPAVAPAPAESRARPPRLIYPARDREVEDAQLFVARLTIDPEGFVVGARLMRGVGGVRDDHAASAVWRFRYSPALDDAGRPIQATIEQRFLVD